MTMGPDPRTTIFVRSVRRGMGSGEGRTGARGAPREASSPDTRAETASRAAPIPGPSPQGRGRVCADCKIAVSCLVPHRSGSESRAAPTSQHASAATRSGRRSPFPRSGGRAGERGSGRRGSTKKDRRSGSERRAGEGGLRAARIVDVGTLTPASRGRTTRSPARPSASARSSRWPAPACARWARSR